MTIRTLLLGLINFYSLTLTFGQTGPLQFKNIGEAQGLKGKLFNEFVNRDCEGFLWIGSLSGCYRFDGLNSKHYIINQDNEYNEFVQSNFFEDKNEDLWFTTYDGLHCYRRVKDQIENFKIKAGSQEYESGYHLFHLDTILSTLWIKADTAVITFNYKTEEIEFQFHTNAMRFLVQRDSIGTLNKIYAFPWFNDQGFQIWTSSSNAHWDVHMFQDKELKNSIISKGILEDSTLWLISRKGLIEFDLHSESAISFHYPKSYPFLHFTGVTLIDSNEMILASKNKGLWSFNTNSKSFTDNWTSENTDKSLKTDELSEINSDNGDGFWISQPQHGLSYSQKKNLKFHNPLGDLKEAIYVRQIIEDAEGNIWVLTKEYGIFVFDPLQNIKNHFPNILGNTIFLNAHLSIDKNGFIWLIMNDQIFRFKENKWRSLYKSSNKLIALAHNSSEYPLLINTEGAYDCVVNKDKTVLKKNSVLRHYDQFSLLEVFETSGPFNFIPIKSRNLIVTEFKNGELNIVDTILMSAVPNKVLYDENKNSYWIGTEKGVLKYELNQPIINVLSKEQLGLSPSVYDMILHNQDSIFLFTGNGICLFDINKAHITRFGEFDGIASNLFNRNSCLLDSNGLIWSGTSKGLCLFDPKNCKLENVKLNVYINELWLNDELYSQKHQLNVNQIKEIHANYGANLKISLSANGDFHSDQIKINFQLKNYDKVWSTTKSGQPIRYANLLAGHHEFLMQVIDEHNLPGPITSFKIIVPPPYWQRAWFWFALLLFIVMIVASIIRIYYNRKLRKQEEKIAKERLIHQERERIASELHDDLGGELSSILYLSESYSYLPKEEQGSQLERISLLSKNALSNMRDIIWILDYSQQKLEDLLAWLQKFSYDFLTAHKINISIEDQIKHYRETNINSEVRREIILIFKECLTNILKHAQTQKVIIIFLVSTGRLKIKVEDFGKGFILDSSKTPGYGLGNMHTRAQKIGGSIEINSQPNQGTVITLSIPLEPKF